MHYPFFRSFRVSTAQLAGVFVRCIWRKRRHCITSIHSFRCRQSGSSVKFRTVSFAVVGVDDFAPIFTKSTYSFQVRRFADEKGLFFLRYHWILPPIRSLVRCIATDADLGQDMAASCLIPIGFYPAHRLLSMLMPITGQLITRQTSCRIVIRPAKGKWQRSRTMHPAINLWPSWR